MTTRSISLAMLATGVVIGLAFSPAALADTEANVEVVPGVTATVTAEMTITSALCGGTDTDYASASVTGTAKAVLSPTQPPFNEVLIDPMYIQFSEMAFSYQFGVCSADLFIEFLEISPLILLNAPIDNDLFEFAGDPYLGWGIMSATVGGVPLDPFHFGSIRMSTLSGRVTGDATTATFDNLAIGPISGEVLADQLPVGIDSITYTISADLSGVSLTGPRCEIEPLCVPEILTFTACLTGPNGGVGGFCGCLDHDGNGDIDLRDFAFFQTHVGP